MSKSPSLRRIQADIRELSIDPSDRYHAAPLENDMFEWHFTIRGADGTDFEGGYYHGRILLPADYPFKPPNIVFLTPSGRFETNVKVCLSFSAYHPELWQPAWGIRLILEALVSFLPTRGDGAIGALDWTSEERKKLAKKSLSYTCPLCGNCAAHMKAIEARILKKRKNHSGSGGGKFQKEIEQLHAMQLANEGGNEKAAATVDGDGDSDNDGDGNNNEKEKGAEEKAETETEIEKEPVMEEPKKQDEVAAADTNTDTDTEKGQENSEEEKADETEPAGQDNGNDEKPTVIDEPPAEKQKNVILDAEAKTEGEEEPVPDTIGAGAGAGAGTGTEVERETETEKETEPEQIPPPQDEGEDPTEGQGQGQQPLQAQPAEVAAAAAPEAAAAAAAGEIQSLDSPLLSDPVVHTGIVIFGIIVYLLVQKIRAIVEDMRELEALFHRE